MLAHPRGNHHCVMLRSHFNMSIQISSGSKWHFLKKKPQCTRIKSAVSCTHRILESDREHNCMYGVCKTAARKFKTGSELKQSWAENIQTWSSIVTITPPAQCRRGVMKCRICLYTTKTFLKHYYWEKRVTDLFLESLCCALSPLKPHLYLVRITEYYSLHPHCWHSTHTIFSVQVPLWHTSLDRG